MSSGATSKYAASAAVTARTSTPVGRKAPAKKPATKKAIIDERRQREQQVRAEKDRREKQEADNEIAARREQAKKESIAKREAKAEQKVVSLAQQGKLSSTVSTDLGVGESKRERIRQREHIRKGDSIRELMDVHRKRTNRPQDDDQNRDNDFDQACAADDALDHIEAAMGCGDITKDELAEHGTSGWLDKWSHNSIRHLKKEWSWQRRYFYLEPQYGRLRYSKWQDFHGDVDGIKGGVHLGDVRQPTTVCVDKTAKESHKREDSSSLDFKFDYHDKEYYLRAESRESRDAWAQRVLSAVIKLTPFPADVSVWLEWMGHQKDKEEARQSPPGSSPSTPPDFDIPEAILAELSQSDFYQQQSNSPRFGAPERTLSLSDADEMIPTSFESEMKSPKASGSPEASGSPTVGKFRASYR